MLALRQVHHIAIIGADYAASKHFYCDILGFTLLSEVYREERGSGSRSGAQRAIHYRAVFFPFAAGPRQPPGGLRPAPSGVQR